MKFKINDRIIFFGKAITRPRAGTVKKISSDDSLWKYAISLDEDTQLTRFSPCWATEDSLWLYTEDNFTRALAMEAIRP